MEKTIISARFGAFTFDPDLEWFEAEIRFAGQVIKLNLMAQNEVDAAPLIANAEAIVADETHWIARLHDCAAGMVDISNEWNEGQDDWEGPIDRDGFVSRIALESIVLYEGDRFEAYFNDGDLFWGHSIVVSGTIADGPQEAATAG